MRGEDERSGWHCHGASGLRSHWWPNNQGNEENQLPRVSFPPSTFSSLLPLPLSPYFGIH
jgi:hypothetical protein